MDDWIQRSALLGTLAYIRKRNVISIQKTFITFEILSRILFDIISDKMLTKSDLINLKRCRTHIIGDNDKILNNVTRRQLQNIDQKKSKCKKQNATTVSRSRPQRPLAFLFYFQQGSKRRE